MLDLRKRRHFRRCGGGEIGELRAVITRLRPRPVRLIWAPCSR